MTILNIKTVYNHCVKESHPGLQQSFASKGFFYETYSIFGSLIAHSLVLLACIPLLAIKRLPEPLEQYPVVWFYQHQWLDELEYIEAPHMRVSFAAARLIDGCLLMATYNPLSQGLSKKMNKNSTGQNQCGGDCN